MSRWMIEKSGTGIEKSGTGIEKSGTGIEKSGTGIEKSGTGIEKSGTGIQRVLITIALTFIAFAGNLQAANIDPAGSLQIVVNNDKVAVSWIIGTSVFSGVTTLNGSYASLMLTEVTLSNKDSALDITGNGTGSNTNITGNGTGSSKNITGNGTGSSKNITGNGTGSSKNITGNGTGSSKNITGNGTGSSKNITGNGTGSSTHITGNGTGSTILISGNSTGSESLAITLPNGTGMNMEVTLGCNTAGVSVVDADSIPVVNFSDVPVLGKSNLCGNTMRKGFDDDFRSAPTRDFQLGE